MEPSESWVTYWWAVVPVAALIYFAYATLKRETSSPSRVALASLTLGVAGLAFCPVAPFAIFLGRKALAAGLQDPTVTIMSRTGIVLGVVGSLFLAVVILIAGIYFYGWVTGQYPVNQANS